MQPLTNNDRFGFYKVGEFKTYSKLEAIEYSGASHLPVEWNFNKDIFEQFDWSQEPPGSLEYWYGERAREIREKYDYIVLWYSGGADSHNVLMSFVKNNIFIDEIAQFHNLGGTNGDKSNFLNEEVFATSAPVTQDLIENNPVYRNTKHRLVDLSELQKDVVTKDDNHWDYFYKVGMYLSPNALARSYMRELVPDYCKLIDQGKSVCFIYGAEKPRVMHNGNGWYVAFNDCLDNAVSPRTQMLNRDWEHNELFYWCDSMPQLVAKQCHVIKRFLSQLTPDMIDNVNVATTMPDPDGALRLITAATAVINNIEYHLRHPGLHRLIYPYYNPEFIVCGKPLSIAYSPRDHWMFNSSAPNIGQKYYHQGLIKLRQTVKQVNPDLWWDSKIKPSATTTYSGGMRSIYNKYRIA